MTKRFPYHKMRIGVRIDDDFLKELGDDAAYMRDMFAKIMARCTLVSKTSVMLGDGTVQEEETFDPVKVSNTLGSITSMLKGWKIQSVTTTRNEDKRRLFTKFSISEGKYALSGHLSLQYHVLLYYTPNQRVLDCQMELSNIIDKTSGHDEKRAELGNEIAKQRLESAGLGNYGEQEMFEALYDNENLCKEIVAEIESQADPEYASLSGKKSKICAELDAYIFEVYKTSHVLIDEARLVGGEEGYLFALDVERDDGTFDPADVPKEMRIAIRKRMSQLTLALENAWKNVDQNCS